MVTKRARNALAVGAVVATVTGVVAAACGTAGAAPAGRAYELVSPNDKSGGNVLWPNDLTLGTGLDAVTAGAADGDTVMYASFQAFPGATSAIVHSYRATRAATGWQTADISPEPTLDHPSVYTANSAIRDASADLAQGVLATRNSYDLDDPGELSDTDVYVRHPDGTLEWVSRGSGPSPSFADAAYAGHSADWRHVLFATPQQLDPAAAGLLAGPALYDRSGGTTTIVSVRDDGTAVTSTCGANVGGLGDTSPGAGAWRTAVSADGSRIAFTSPDPFTAAFGFDPSCAEPFRLYLRDGDRTRDVSTSQRAVPDPSGPLAARFQAASADGSRVWFTSNEALTDDALPLGGEDAPFLYRYDAGSGRLTLVTPNEPDASGPGVAGVLAAAPDGSRVWFIAQGTLYVADDRGATPIGRAGSITDASAVLGGFEGGRQVRVSADGRRIVFALRGDLTAFATDGEQEVYLHDVDAGLRCVSCNGDGHVPLGDATLRPDIVGSSLQPRNLLDDGSVLFETVDTLTASDDNSAADVYRWHDGTVELLTDGREQFGSHFVDATSDGRDIFFSTTASLVGWDTDNGGVDVYDARRGGGFPEPPVPQRECVGDACQGQPAPAPRPQAPASESYRGPEQPPRSDLPARVRVRGARVVRGSIVLSISVPGRGRLTTSGHWIRATRRAIPKAAKVSVRAPLTAAARRRLRRVRRLTIEVHVRFVPHDGGRVSSRVVRLTAKGR